MRTRHHQVIKYSQVIFITLIFFLITYIPVNAQNSFPPDRDALIESINEQSESEHVVNDIQIRGNYATGAVVDTRNGEYIEGSGTIFIAEWNGAAWNIYFEGTKEFRERLPEVPSSMLSSDAKILLDYENGSLLNTLFDYTLSGSGYKLPFPNGVSYYVSRAWETGSCPHGTQSPTNAIDFVMPLNSTIVAARSGIVQDVVENLTICGCVQTNSANWIVIRHEPDDGLTDWYLHIAPNGAIVNEGDRVVQGQPIAYSHQIGYSCGSSTCAPGTCPSSCNPAAHLHFHVRNSAGQRVYITFDDVGAVVGCKTYTSGNVYDTVPPTSAISLSGTLGDNAWYRTSVTATISATDNNSGVSYSQYNLNGAGWINYTTPFVIHNNGSNILQFRSIDAAGNWEIAQTSTFKIDTGNPSNPVSIEPGCDIQNDIWQNSCNDLSFIWTGAVDAMSGIAGYQYYWGDDPAGTATTEITSANFDPQPVTDGIYYLRIRTKDNAGNLSNWVTQFTLRFDGTPPTGQITIENNRESTHRTQVSLYAEALDSSSGLNSFRLRNAGETWTEWTTAKNSMVWFLRPQTDELQIVEIEFRDTAGNTSISSDSIFLDIYPDQPASGHFRLIKNTFGLGGANTISANYNLFSTISQPSVIGFSLSTNYRTSLGFWYRIYAIQPPNVPFSIFLPLIKK